MAELIVPKRATLGSGQSFGNGNGQPYGYVRPEPANGTEALPEPCNKPQRFLGGGNDLQFFTIQTAGGNAQADVPVTLPNSCRFIMCASVPNAHLADSLYLHFDKLNKTYAASAILPTGFENWFPMSQTPQSLSKIGIWFRFKNYMPPIVYFDIGQEGGAGAYPITFVTGNDMEALGSMFSTVT